MNSYQSSNSKTLTMRLLISTILFLLSILQGAYAQTFSLSQGNVVGKVQIAVAKQGDTLAQIARDYGMGYEEMLEANPNISDPDHLLGGTVLVIPSQFVLPNAPHNGMVVNLAEMRLYYYPPGSGRVVTHPMGIGREGEDTPLGVMKIIQHMVKPTWHVPESIRQMRAEQGVFLPKSVPPGPENPLGEYAMRLSRPTYLIHGTNDPLGGIGRRSSSGCLRMYPEDIESLFHMVGNGTPVYVVNEPYKAAWGGDGRLYLESHIALQGDENQVEKDHEKIRQIVETAISGQSADVDWDRVSTIASETQGLPQVVGKAG